MDIALFKYYAMKHGDTMRDIAQTLQVARVTMTNKLYGHTGSDFSRGDIAKLKSRWHLTNDQVAEIFFSKSEA